MFVLPSQVSAQCTPSPEGQSVGACGCAAGLVVGPASKCITQANFNFAIPALNKVEDGALKQSKDQLNSFGYIDESNVGMWGSLVLGIGGSTLPNRLTGDSGLSSGSKMIGLLYTPVAGEKEYVADLLHDAGIATPAYAQGLGFSALAPVLETWKIFRTVAYFFYVVIFLIIGFMIMFRQKIGSQTVVTVQQALPKLLISLIAVTFSYAIAGLMIEIMYLVMFFIVNIFAASTIGQTPLNGVNLQSFGSNSNIFSVAGIILSGGFTNTVTDSVGKIVNGALGITDGQAGTAIGSITGLAAAVVFALALLFSLFRLFFELLKTYISIIIAIVTAPLALMLGALPGNNAFVAWIKGLFFNLAVFPTVLITIVMAYLLQTSIAQNGGFLPPYIGGAGTAGNVAPLLGLGVLLVIPDVVEKVKKMAPPGPFDEFANKAGTALKKGYAGGQLVDGLGFTDTRKLPGGGLSGENVLRKAGIGAAGGVAGVAAGIPRGLWREGGAGIAAGVGGTSKDVAARLSILTGDPTLKKWAEDRQKQKKEVGEKKTPY